MTRSWQYPAIALLAVLALAVIAFRPWSASGAVTREPTSPVGTPPETTAVRKAPLEQGELAARSPVEPRIDTPSLLVRIRDHLGAPVPGATVSLVSPHAQWVASVDRRRVGDPSDESGTIDLPLEMIEEARIEAPDPSWRFVVEHADHLPAELPIAPPEVVLVLDRAESLEVECVSEDGQPIAGVAVAVSRFFEFEALRTAVMRTLQHGSAPAPGPLAADRAVCVGVSDAKGLLQLTGCAPGRHAWLAGHEAWVPVDASTTARAVEIPGDRLRIVLTELVAACIAPSDPESVLSINTDRSNADFDSGPFSRHGGFAAAIQLAKPKLPTGFRVAVPSARLRRDEGLPELRYSVLFPSGWSHVTVPMRAIAGGVEPVPVTAPDGPDVTGFLVIRVVGMPDRASTGAPLPVIEVLGDGTAGGTFHRVTRCGERLRLPAGDYQLLCENPWIDADQPVHVSRGELTEVSLPALRELRPCRIELAGPMGAVVPAIDLWIGPRDARDRGLVLGSWIPGLEHEAPERGADHWLPVGDILVAVKGRGVAKAEHPFVVDQRYEPQILRLPVELAQQ